MVKTHKKGSAEKLSANFKVSEFACHGSGCCSSVLIDTGLVEILQKIRDYFGKPVIITSGYRCATHNKTVGGVTGSKHTEGKAADISVQGVTPAEVAKYAESIGVRGIGLYETAADGYFVHVDTRTNKSFWYGQKEQHRDTFGGAVQKPVETVEKSAALPVLRKGAESDTVYALQVLLAGYGYLRGMYVNAEFTEETETALKDYQREHDLTADGVCGSLTWKKLLGV